MTQKLSNQTNHHKKNFSSRGGINPACAYFYKLSKKNKLNCVATHSGWLKTPLAHPMGACNQGKEAFRAKSMQSGQLRPLCEYWRSLGLRGLYPLQVELYLIDKINSASKSAVFRFVSVGLSLRSSSSLPQKSSISRR